MADAATRAFEHQRVRPVQCREKSGWRRASWPVTTKPLVVASAALASSGGLQASTTLLLLHGYPSSSAQYGKLMERLEDRYKRGGPMQGRAPPMSCSPD